MFPVLFSALTVAGLLWLTPRRAALPTSLPTRPQAVSSRSPSPSSDIASSTDWPWRLFSYAPDGSWRYEGDVADIDTGLASVAVLKSDKKPFFYLQVLHAGEVGPASLSPPLTAAASSNFSVWWIDGGEVNQDKIADNAPGWYASGRMKEYFDRAITEDFLIQPSP